MLVRQRIGRPDAELSAVEGGNAALPTGKLLWLDSPEGLTWDETSVPRADGGFDFENVPAGRYRMHIRVGTDGPYYIKSLRYGAMESSDTAFSISAGDSGGTVELTLSPRGAILNGMVRRTGAGGSAPPPRIVLLPETSDPELQIYDTHLGVLDQLGGFTIRNAVRPGKYTLFAFEDVPDGAWTDAEFMKRIEGRGVPVQVDEGDTKTVEVPLILKADTTALLTRLGMN